MITREALQRQGQTVEKMKREFILEETRHAYLDVPDGGWYEVRRYKEFDRAYAALERLAKRAHPPGGGWCFNTRLLDSATGTEVETEEIWDYQYAQLHSIPSSHISAERSAGDGTGSRLVVILARQ